MDIMCMQAHLQTHGAVTLRNGIVRLASPRRRYHGAGGVAWPHRLLAHAPSGVVVRLLLRR